MGWSVDCGGLTGVDAEEQSFGVRVCCELLEAFAFARRREASVVGLQTAVVVHIHRLRIKVEIP